MAIKHPNESPTRSPLRLWPGVVAVVLQWLAWLGTPLVVSGIMAAYIGVAGLLLGALTIVVWWMFFSRAPWSERLGALALMVVGLAVTPNFLHRSVAEGNLGFQYFMYAVPVLCLAFVVWAVASARLPKGPRRVTMAATILMACGAFALLRSGGIGSDASAEFVWRWSQSAEEELLAQADDEPLAPLSAEAALTAAERGDDWPGFRGPQRDGVVPGLCIETDWSASPPLELWRRPVGPGVSSFAVHGDLLYTQEQRGEDEIVACYRVSTGEPVWRHLDTIRFWDSHVGAGPRATPALGDGRVYALGATGILNALDAAEGSVVWTRNVAADVGAKPPMFGFTSSPLVVDDVVIAYTAALVACDLSSGDQRWSGPARGGSYGSPHLLTIDGVRQILMLSGSSLKSVAPTDGSLLWEQPLPGGSIVQPAQTDEGDVLISISDIDSAAPLGTRRLAVTQGPGGWAIQERWASKALKPSFSSVVVHKGHAYGFDNRFVACIDLEDGKRKWKGGRYGVGQLLLLPDQDLLLVVSEQGDVALVAAAPDKFTELASFPAIEGKTWNNPVIAGDVLLVRNRKEMAAFRLPLAGG